MKQKTSPETSNPAKQPRVHSSNGPLQMMKEDSPLHSVSAVSPLHREFRSPLSGATGEVVELVEESLGVDLSSVQIKEDASLPVALGAKAVTQGETIHFAPGYAPVSADGRHTLAHELAHVVQQRQGRVRPTGYLAGTAVNEDPELEAEAIEWGEMALAGKQVDIGGSSDAMTNSMVAQMDPLPGELDWGHFEGDSYVIEIAAGGNPYDKNMKLIFTPVLTKEQWETKNRIGVYDDKQRVIVKAILNQDEANALEFSFYLWNNSWGETTYIPDANSYGTQDPASGPKLYRQHFDGLLRHFEVVEQSIGGIFYGFQLKLNDTDGNRRQTKLTISQSDIYDESGKETLPSSVYTVKIEGFRNNEIELDFTESAFHWDDTPVFDNKIALEGPVLDGFEDQPIEKVSNGFKINAVTHPYGDTFVLHFSQVEDSRLVHLTVKMEDKNEVVWPNPFSFYLPKAEQITSVKRVPYKNQESIGGLHESFMGLAFNGSQHPTLVISSSFQVLAYDESGHKRLAILMVKSFNQTENRTGFNLENSGKQGKDYAQRRKYTVVNDKGNLEYSSKKADVDELSFQTESWTSARDVLPELRASNSLEEELSFLNATTLMQLTAYVKAEFIPADIFDAFLSYSRIAYLLLGQKSNLEKNRDNLSLDEETTFSALRAYGITLLNFIYPEAVESGDKAPTEEASQDNPSFKELHQSSNEKPSFKEMHLAAFEQNYQDKDIMGLVGLITVVKSSLLQMGSQRMAEQYKWDQNFKAAMDGEDYDEATHNQAAKAMQAAHQAAGNLRTSLLAYDNKYGINRETFQGVQAIFYPERDNVVGVGKLKYLQVPLYTQYTQNGNQVNWTVISLINKSTHSFFHFDYTQTIDPTTAERDENGLLIPPLELFKGLNHKFHLPEGMLVYNNRDGSGGAIKMTAPYEWYDWVWWGSMALLLGAFAVATMGFGTAGAVIMAGSAATGLVSSIGAMVDKSDHGVEITGADYFFLALDILAVVFSLARLAKVVNVGKTNSFVQQSNKVVTGQNGVKGTLVTRQRWAYFLLEGGELAADTVGIIAANITSIQAIWKIADGPGTFEEKAIAIGKILGLLVVQNAFFSATVKGRANLVSDIANGRFLIEPPTAMGAKTGSLPDPLLQKVNQGRLSMEGAETLKLNLGDTEAIKAANALEKMDPIETAGLMARYGENNVAYASYKHGGDLDKVQAELKRLPGLVDKGDDVAKSAMNREKIHQTTGRKDILEDQRIAQEKLNKAKISYQEASGKLKPKNLKEFADDAEYQSRKATLKQEGTDLQDTKTRLESEYQTLGGEKNTKNLEYIGENSILDRLKGKKKTLEAKDLTLKGKENALAAKETEVKRLDGEIEAVEDKIPVTQKRLDKLAYELPAFRGQKRQYFKVKPKVNHASSAMSERNVIGDFEANYKQFTTEYDLPVSELQTVKNAQTAYYEARKLVDGKVGEISIQHVDMLDSFKVKEAYKVKYEQEYKKYWEMFAGSDSELKKMSKEIGKKSKANHVAKEKFPGNRPKNLISEEEAIRIRGELDLKKMELEELEFEITQAKKMTDEEILEEGSPLEGLENIKAELELDIKNLEKPLGIYDDFINARSKYGKQQKKILDTEDEIARLRYEYDELMRSKINERLPLDYVEVKTAEFLEISESLIHAERKAYFAYRTLMYNLEFPTRTNQVKTYEANLKERTRLNEEIVRDKPGLEKERTTLDLSMEENATKIGVSKDRIIQLEKEMDDLDTKLGVNKGLRDQNTQDLIQHQKNRDNFLLQEDAFKKKAYQTAANQELNQISSDMQKAKNKWGPEVVNYNTAYTNTQQVTESYGKAILRYTGYILTFHFMATMLTNAYKKLATSVFSKADPQALVLQKVIYKMAGKTRGSLAKSESRKVKTTNYMRMDSALSQLETYLEQSIDFSFRMQVNAPILWKELDEDFMAVADLLVPDVFSSPEEISQLLEGMDALEDLMDANDQFLSEKVTVNPYGSDSDVPDWEPIRTEMDPEEIKAIEEWLDTQKSTPTPEKQD